LEFAKLPRPFARDINEALQSMLYQLQSQHLDVILVPAPVPKFVGHKIRVVNTQNPEWYRFYFQQFGANFVVRSRTISNLKSMCIGKNVKGSRQDKALMEIAKKLVCTGEYTDEYGEEIDGELSSVPEPDTWTEDYEPPF